MDLKTLALHGGLSHPYLDGAVAPPLQLSTTFERAADGSYPQRFSYGRTANPNRDSLEATLTALEGGTACATFASGTAATMAVYQSLSAGDHVIVPQEAYHGTRTMLQKIFPRWGLQSTFVDMTDLVAVRAALRPTTKLLWVETPSNPTMRVTDLAAVAEIAHAHGAICVADNTVATPLLQRPFEFGCDLVVHSTTKYMNGHSDVTGGCVIARASSEVFERIRTIQIHGGAIPSPFDCWLVERGLKTMAYRVQAQSDSALRLAEFLKSARGVTRVYYAGLQDHPQHALAARQMRRFGGLLSFEVGGGTKAALAVAGACRIITRATSLGGVESLIEQRASMEGPDTTTPPGLLRFSVGLEATDDLIADLTRALRVLEDLR